MKLWNLLTSLGTTAVVSAFVLSSAQGAVKDTKHNMNKVFGNNTIQDNQVCLPCHAPHNQPDKTQDVLWNHVMPTQSYKLFSTGKDLQGRDLVESALVVGLDETSKKCLSCHDGSVAVDSYGGYTFSKTVGGSIFGPTTGTHTLGAQNDIGGGSTAAFVVGAGGDLSHDHPVGVQYPATGYNDPTKWTRTGYTTGVTVVYYKNPDGTSVYNTPGDPASGEKGAAVAGGGFELEGGNIAGVGVVGCGSCHSPHSDTYNFLTISNYGSQLCMTCHTR